MRAIAPGKLVVSGAYSVLWGAPAIVTAVDRYVVADTSRAPGFVTAEVAAAVDRGRAPWFDASALRSGDRKLGLGSSAAILVASLAALELEGDPGMDSEALAARVFPRALAAHRKAQGGGSGIDVAASAFGATRRCVMRGAELVVEPFELPEGVAILAYAERESSSTRGMVARVKAYAERDPSAFDATMRALMGRASEAASPHSAREFLGALRGQVELLSELGDRAGAPIVPVSLRTTAREALQDGVVVMPSGAGGGDVVICVGDAGECARWGGRLEREGLERIGLRVGAAGVRRGS